MKTLIKNFLRDESGASAAEYALILAVVGVVIAGAGMMLANEIEDSLQATGERLEDCSEAAGGTTNTGCPVGTELD